MTSPYPGNSLWPGDYSASTITGRYVGADGSTFAGRQLTITMPGYVIVPVDATTVVPASITVTLDETGFFRQAVPATDDPDIQPIDWTYTIVELWEGGRTFYSSAPAGQTNDVSQVAPVAQSLGTVTYVGAQGEQGDTGPIGIVWREAWDPAAQYDVTDAVSWQGSSYIALLANTGLQPDTHNVYWGLLADAGVNGLPGTADLGPVTLSGAPNAGDSIIATDSTHAAWGPQAFPPGMVMPFAGPLQNVPAGWLPCDGSLLTRTTYPALFAAIGTTWGVGDGSTTFNLPDLSAAMPFGAPVGSSGGSPTHTHGVSALETSGHTHGSSQMSAAGHTHPIPAIPVGPHVHQLGDTGWAQAFMAAESGNNFFMRRIALPGQYVWDPNLQASFPAVSAPGALPQTVGVALDGVTGGLQAAADNPTAISGSAGAVLLGNTDPTNEALTGNTDPGSTMPPYLGMVFLIKT